MLAHNDRALGPRLRQSAVADQRAHARDLEASRYRLVCRRGSAPRLRLRERLYSEALLSAGVRRVRRPAGIGGRPLRRQPAWCRSAPRAWNCSSRRSSEALEQVLDCEALLFKNDGAARELEGLAELCRGREGRVRRTRHWSSRTAWNSRCRWPRGRRPAGSSIRPPTAAR